MLRTLFKQGSVYALVGVVSKLSGFVLMALYGDPELFSPTEFGDLSVLDAVKTFAVLVGSAGLPLALIRFAADTAAPEETRGAVAATTLALSAGAGLVAGGLVWLLAPALSAWLFGSAALAEPVRWLALFVAIKATADVSFTELRRREKPGWFVALSALEMGALVAAVAYFLVVERAGLVGVMKGYVVSAAVLFAVGVPVLLANIERRVARELVRPMLAFGVPLVLSGLAGVFLKLGDRFLIRLLLDAEANAVYEWASRFGSVVNALLVQSFQLAFTVLGMKALGAGSPPDLHRSAFRHVAAAAGWMALGLGLLVGDVSRWLTPVEAYIDTGGLTLLVAGGFGFYGLYFVTVNVLYSAGRTREVAWSVVAAGLLNAALNAALIPALGVAGAALATLLAYAALAFGTARIAGRSLDVRYPWRVPLVAAAVAAVLWGAGTWTPPTALGLAGRLGLLALYPPVLFAAGLYDRHDLRRAADVLGLGGREHAGSTPDADTDGEGPGRS